MKAPFSPRTIRDIQYLYFHTCSVCLQPLIKGQCAHLFRKAASGQKEVEEAISLGLLPEEPYERTHADNGTLQCPTCHLEYFTKRLMVWSPPLDLLRWIYRKMMGKKETNEIRRIFDMLDYEETFPPELEHLFSLYSLIPIFKSKHPNKRYDLHCRLPPLSILVDGRFRQDIVAEGGEPTFRVFQTWEKQARRIFNSDTTDAGVISFFATPQKKDNTTVPTNYWWLPVSCGVILYLFILEAREIPEDTRPELRLARQIYSYLRRIEERNDKRKAKFSTKRAMKENIHVSDKEETEASYTAETDSDNKEETKPSSTEGDIDSDDDEEETAEMGDDDGLNRPSTSHVTPRIQRAQSEPLSGRKATPKTAMCRIHSALHHHKSYCRKCYRIERISPPRLSLDSADEEEEPELPGIGSRKWERTEGPSGSPLHDHLDDPFTAVRAPYREVK
ncbi:hypothetical protein DFH09DRAFT_1355014 [Mycena vulgaris]|nr:hypothetical protein DFH09DRAFT_1355014 [Mycena vulgaris]